MTEMQSPPEGVRHAAAISAAPEPTAWVGWIFFAGTMLVLVGSFQGLAGFVALFNDDVYVRSARLAVSINYTGWGWAHILLGVVAIAGGYGVMVGKTWARVYAIVYASIAALVNLTFLAAYPAWMSIMITLDVLVIWALTVHGRELKTAV
jgi:hypothetical protein